MNSYKRGQAFVYRSLHTYLINLLSGLETICFISAKRHYRQASRELCSVQKGTYTYITKHGLLYLPGGPKKTEPKFSVTQLLKTTQAHFFCYEHELQSMTFWFIQAKHQKPHLIRRDDVILKHAQNESTGPFFILLLETLETLYVFRGIGFFSWFNTRMDP